MTDSTPAPTRGIGDDATAAVALLLAFGRWDHPGWAVPGALLVAVGAAVHLTAVEHQARAGRRWRAEPPGPPRN